MKIKLDERCARSDLTDREITKIIGGQLYAFVEMSDIETTRRAVRWLAETDEFWKFLGVTKNELDKACDRAFANR